MTDNKIGGSKTIIYTSVISAVVGVVSLAGVLYQFQQSNKLKRFDNYSMFNKVYDDWYVNMPDAIKKCDSKKRVEWNSLDLHSTHFERRIFELLQPC
jgi:hypothetical protein